MPIISEQRQYFSFHCEWRTLARVSIGAFLVLFACHTCLAWQTDPAPTALTPIFEAEGTNSTRRFQLQPNSTEKDAAVRHIEAAIRVPSFKSVTPGKTSLAAAKQILGNPVSELAEAGNAVLTFQIDPFEKVEMIGDQRAISSIVIYLREATSVTDLTKEIKLDTIRPAPIPDESGHVLGQVFPERGVLFVFAPGAGQPKVAQIILEAITAEPFVLRAQYDTDHKYEDNLADLTYARRLEPNNAKVGWLLATIYSSAGDHTQAIKFAEDAVRLDPTLPEYRLKVAELLVETGQHDLAFEVIQVVLGVQNLSEQVRARAECQLGDLLASSADPDYKMALQHHQRAIKLAVPLATDSRFKVRQTAKKILIDAHLGVAADVAFGKWRRKEEVVPKWLAHANALAAEMIMNERGGGELKLQVNKKALAIYAKIGNQNDPTQIADITIQDCQRLIAGNDDRLYRAGVQRQLGEVLFSIATIQHKRRQPTNALAQAEQALYYLRQSNASIDTTPQQDYQLGRLYTFIGSIHATHTGDHEKAIVWYQKALPLIGKLDVAGQEQAIHGERLVSMGVSYWQTGDRSKALDLTRQGASLIQQAVENRLVAEDALTIPYGNLAGMYKQMGHSRDAKQYADTAAKLRASGGGSKLR